MNSRCRCNIREVARQAKVSVATVSRALNNRSPLTEKTRARVLRTVQKLNYQPDPIFRLAFQR
ncbi:MAG: LacI family DNA-binding transcriptional regulator [Verrucomicrobia bacterium]|nr:LacI family DNA-binding transcriptional regulator [Verrucomicrobiota bacterium]